MKKYGIWQTPQVGKMNQIPCCDWLPKQVSRDYTFCCPNNILPKLKQVHKSFLLQKIFCDFCPDGTREQENQNAPSLLQITGFRFSAKKYTSIKIIFSVFFMPYNKSFTDQASLVKMAGCWPCSLVAFYRPRLRLSP